MFDWRVMNGLGFGLVHDHLAVPGDDRQVYEVPAVVLQFLCFEFVWMLR